MRKINKIHFPFFVLFLICAAQTPPAYAEVIPVTVNNKDYELNLSGYGVGISTSQEITQTATSLTGWIPLSDSLSLQPYIGTNNTRPLHFGLGAAIKGTVMGDQTTGLHVGGGASFGTTQSLDLFHNQKLFVKVFALGGIHFSFESLKNIHFHFDIGPALTSIANELKFNFGATSPVLGASIFYFF